MFKCDKVNYNYIFHKSLIVVNTYILGKYVKL